MQHVFIASLGGAPQVLTEALWALMHPEYLLDPAHRAREAVAPSVVHILATAHHRPFGSVTERDEVVRTKIAELYSRCGRPPPAISIVPVGEGNHHLTDVRTEKENILYANQITNLVREQARDGVVLHMLLAGGRKTMSSYDQVAMMFFGRPRDELIHVLVEPEDLERAWDFWWPGQPQNSVRTATGAELATSPEAATVDLVNVPFVRLNVTPPSYALDYHRLVEFVQFEQNREKIVVDVDSCTIKSGSEEIAVQPGVFIFFAVLAILRKVGWRPTAQDGGGARPMPPGALPLNLLRYGSRPEGRERVEDVKPPLILARKLSRRVFQGVDDGRLRRDEDWVMRAVAAVRGEDDATATTRSRWREIVNQRVENPFARSMLAPEQSDERPPTIWLESPSDRLDIRGCDDLIAEMDAPLS